MEWGGCSRKAPWGRHLSRDLYGVSEPFRDMGEVIRIEGTASV